MGTMGADKRAVSRLVWVLFGLAAACSVFLLGRWTAPSIQTDPMTRVGRRSISLVGGIVGISDRRLVLLEHPFGARRKLRCQEKQS